MADIKYFRTKNEGSISELFEDDVILPEYLYRRICVPSEAHEFVQTIWNMMPVQRCIILTDIIIKLLAKYEKNPNNEDWGDILDYMLEGMPVYDALINTRIQIELITYDELNHMLFDELIIFLKKYFYKMSDVLKNGTYAEEEGQFYIQNHSMVVGIANLQDV